MKRMMLPVMMLLLFLSGCSSDPDGGETTPTAAQAGPDITSGSLPTGSDTEMEKEKIIIDEAAWCIYWYPASAEAAAENYTRYKELVLFGCIYSDDHSLYVPTQLEELIAKLPEKTAGNAPEYYMSFINDVMHPDGSSTQKSTDFLQEVLTDAALSDRIIDDMIKQTKERGFDGLELDYENIHKCDGLWDAYLDFVSKLYNRAVSEDLKLRVVLSVSTPADRLDFIKGPQYVVMCYNLYGNHSGPGPKADEAFLRDTCRKFQALDAEYALANGGFEWGSDGKTLRSLTAADAAALAEEKAATKIREDNGAVRFSFQAEDGEHTVYYGDEETIGCWSRILLDQADQDIRINLWRLE